MSKRNIILMAVCCLFISALTTNAGAGIVKPLEKKENREKLRKAQKEMTYDLVPTVKSIFSKQQETDKVIGELLSEIKKQNVLMDTNNKLLEVIARTLTNKPKSSKKH